MRISSDGAAGAARRVTHDQHRAGALLAVATLTVMASAIIAPSMPHMAEAFRTAPHAELLTKLVLTMPALAIALAAPLAGAVIDRFGRIRLLRASLVLYGAAGAAGWVLEHLDLMLISRAALGLAIAGTMTTMTTLAGDYFHGEARNRFTSRQSMVMSIGAVICFAAGGLLADVNWRLPFLMYLAGWVILIPVVAFLDEPRRAAPAAAGAVATRAPRGRIAFVYVTTFVLVAMFYMTAVQIPFLLPAIGIERAAAAGFAIAATSLAAALGSWWYPRLRHRAGFLHVYAASFALMGAGYLLIGATASYAVVLAGAFVAGFGVGLFFPNSSLALLAAAPPALRGRLIGGLTAAIFLGQFFSPILAQPVVAATSLGATFAICGTAMLAAAVALAAWRERAAAPRSVPGAPTP